MTPSGTQPSETSRPIMRVRITLEGSQPEIWRLLEIDGSLRLDQVHEVLQRAVGWRDEHLHSFSFDHSPWYLAQRSLDEGMEGELETGHHLKDLLTEESGSLFYLYDFGDGWKHRIELIEILPENPESPRAILIDGERRAPLENSGGIDGYTETLAILADPEDDRHDELNHWASLMTGPWQEFDPEHFDAQAVNRELKLLFADPRDSSSELSPALSALMNRLYPQVQGEFRTYLETSKVAEPLVMDRDLVERVVGPFLWLIRRIGTGGLKLTGAGWLPPVVVNDAMRELGWEDRWLGKMNREDLTIPILELRESATDLGLIRKRKGHLHLTKRAAELIDDPIGLWWFLAEAVPTHDRHRILNDLTVLMAIEISGGERDDRRKYVEPVNFGLEALGWSAENGSIHEVVEEMIQLRWALFESLEAFSAERGRGFRDCVTPEGQLFARAMLQARR